MVRKRGAGCECRSAAKGRGAPPRSGSILASCRLGSVTSSPWVEPGERCIDHVFRVMTIDGAGLAMAGRRFPDRGRAVHAVQRLRRDTHHRGDIDDGAAPRATNAGAPA